MVPYSQWILMFAVVVMASLFPRQYRPAKPEGPVCMRRLSNPVFTTVAILLMIFFSANTIANDVNNYRINYTILNSDLTWRELYESGIGSNPLFAFLQITFKRLVSENPAAFQFFVAAIVQTGMVLFYRRYSPSLPMSLFMFIASGLFFFTMVSWKQSMAMCLGLMCVPLVEKKKYLLYAALLLVIMLIHPYIAMYAMLPFLVNDKIWTRRNILMIAIMCVAGFSLSKIIAPALEVTEMMFGDVHDAGYFNQEHGVGYQRIIFFAITPVLSIIYRKRLDTNPYPLMNGFIQMSVISFGFMLMSGSGGANFISRMATYFEPFTYVGLPYILLYIVPSNSRTAIKWGVFFLYFIFFCFLQLKRGSIF